MSDHDFFAQYIQFASETTDCPEMFHWFVSYGVCSAAIGRNCHFPFGDNLLFPNLWLILIAPSSEYRKSTALGIGLGMLRKVNSNLVLPSRFTEEAFMNDLTLNPQGLIPFYEFKALLDLVRKDYNSGLKSLLTELYDVPDFLVRRTMAGEKIVERPCVSIMAATTMEWFLNSCKEDDFGSGFLPRFLFVPVRSKSRDLPIPPPADQVKKQKLIDELVQIQKVKGVMSLTSEALNAHNNWYRAFKTRDKIPQFMGIYSRLQIYLIKFAMIHSIVVFRSLDINEASIKEAIALIDWLLTEFEGLANSEFTFSKFEKQKKKILGLIQSGKNERSVLVRHSNLSAREFNEVISTLIEGGRVKEHKDGNGPTMYYEQV